MQPGIFRTGKYKGKVQDCLSSLWG